MTGEAVSFFRAASPKAVSMGMICFLRDMTFAERLAVLRRDGVGLPDILVVADETEGGALLEHVGGPSG
jgi:hypothetical protein